MLPLRIQNGIGVTREAASTGSDQNVVTWLQRVMKLLPGHRTQTKSLRHIETLPLGVKRAVFLIECDGQRFLVADGMSAPVALTQRFAAEDRR